MATNKQTKSKEVQVTTPDSTWQRDLLQISSGDETIMGKTSCGGIAGLLANRAQKRRKNVIRLAKLSEPYKKGTGDNA